MQRCQVVWLWRSPVSRSFQLRLVASERLVNEFWFLVVLISASLPRNPMRVARLAYITVLLFLLPVSVGALNSERSRSQERSGEPECIVGGTGRESGEVAAGDRTNPQGRISAGGADKAE